MKRILLGVIFCCLWSVSSWGQGLIRIEGPNYVNANSIQYYRIDYAISQSMKVKILVSHGTIELSTSNTKEVTLSGSGTYSFSVKWNDVGSTVKDAVIAAYPIGGNIEGAGVTLEKITITKIDGGSTTPPNPGSEDVGKLFHHYPNGNNVISGDTILFGYKDKLPASYYYIEDWTYDRNLFREIDRKSHMITLVAKQVTGITATYAEVKIHVKERLAPFISQDVLNHTWGLKIYGTPYIEKIGNRVACSNQNTEYQIGNLHIPNRVWQSVSWQSGQNMTLISGQGTPNAVFRASGNGYGTVKAKVVYDNGQTFEIENSDIWVGPPAPLTSLTGFEQGTFAPNQRVYIGAMSGGATDYIWGLSGDARFDLSYYQGMAIAPIVTSVPTGQGMFTIEVYAKNQCGRSNAIRKSGIVNGTNSGDPTPPMVEKSGTVSDVTSTPVSIKIYSFNTGSVVYQKKNVVNFNIQDTGLNDGIYIVETIDSKGNRTSNKVFKKKQ